MYNTDENQALLKKYYILQNINKSVNEMHINFNAKYNHNYDDKLSFEKTISQDLQLVENAIKNYLYHSTSINKDKSNEIEELKNRIDIIKKSL